MAEREIMIDRLTRSARRRAAGATPVLAPLLLAQGLWVRSRTPLLPEAAPPYAGAVEGDGKPLRLVLVGESTAAGVGVATHAAGLAGQTAIALASLSGRPVVWCAMGKNGATVAAVRAQLAPVVMRAGVDLVLVSLGVNDTVRMTPLARWRAELAALLAHLQSWSLDGAIVLTGVPPMERLPAFPEPLRTFLGRRARLLDATAAGLAAALPHVLHVPTPLPDPVHLAVDHFHPGADGYAAWARVLAARVIDAGLIE